MTPDAPVRRPRFSIVTAVYDVARYLPDFIRSIEGQAVEPGDLEIIAVDDGSRDASLELLHDWARTSRFRVRVEAQSNAGQGAARNRGLALAAGEWVNFADPDDRLGEGYLVALDRFARRHPDVELLAARPVLHLEAEDRLLDRHPRWRQYRRGNRVADLEAEPNTFPGSTNVGFYRLDRLRAAGLEFDPRIRPNFEDGHFAVSYLLSLNRPVVGLVRDAAYLYRKRADQSSVLQRSLQDPRRYTTVLELGYLDVLRRANERFGRVPEWLGQVLVYELSWYLGEDEKLASGAIVDEATLSRFHELLAEILGHLEPAVVGRHRVLALPSQRADVLAHGGAARAGSWHSPFVVGTAVDRAMRLRRLSYRFRGEQPVEAVRIDGEAVAPAFEKTIGISYYGRPLLFERALWVPLDGRLEVSLGGAVVPVVSRWRKPGREPARDRAAAGPLDASGDGSGDGGRSAGGGSRATAGAATTVPSTRRRAPAARPGFRPLRGLRGLRRLSRRGARTLAGLAGGRGRRVRQRLTGLALRRLAASNPWRGRFRDAWLFMDRVHDADDNGERLFEHVRRARPEVNAWFVLERGTPDWHRLHAIHGDRLLAHGSLAWKLAMLNCTWLLSSHVDLPVYRPPALAGTGPATWRFGFLQHGIIKDDLSVWLNRRELELFVVSTPAELESVAGDGTAYKFTHKETRNTGLPRFDRLLAEGGVVPVEDRDLVIVAPTWRQWLAAPEHGASQRRRLQDALWESDYLSNWLGLLRSPDIARAVANRGWRLGFMPHPNLQSMLEALDLPDHVERLSFAGTDVQALYARAALLVTDYSSVAFNAAYLDRPVVYFQFDRDRMLGGGHVGRKGYFEYERDGFGPVALDLASAVGAVLASIDRGPSPAPEYQARIDATFPVRDGRACERVVAAVEELSRPRAAGSGEGT